MSATQPEQLYESDFYAWTQAQAKELRRFARTRPSVPLDLAHLAEAIHDLGKSEYEAAFSLTQRIIFSRDRSAAPLVRRVRRVSRPDRAQTFACRPAPAEARVRGGVQTRSLARAARYSKTHAAATLPAKCPYTLEQVLGDWLPGEAC